MRVSVVSVFIERRNLQLCYLYAWWCIDKACYLGGFSIVKAVCFVVARLLCGSPSLVGRCCDEKHGCITLCRIAASFQYLGRCPSEAHGKASDA